LAQGEIFLKTLRSITLLFLVSFFTSPVWAVGGGGWSMGLNLGFINAEQKDLNKAITAMNDTDNAGVSEFGNTWEFNASINYRMQGSTALMFRPSYFYNAAEEGTGTSGSYEYQVTGFTLFPMLRWYLLEDQTIKFYSQFGVGYGQISGKIKEQTLDLEFSGGSLGYAFGLGAEFCFVADHCLNVEGGIRFLSVDRLKVDSSIGTAPTGSKITQSGKGDELEISNRDLSATMSGVLGMIGYTLYF
jgi:hypothetical protein